MSAGLVSFLFTAGASAWLYAKFQRYSGNNTQQSVIATGISAVVIFIIFFFVFHSFIN